MQIDPLNDALIKMYNAEQAGKFNVELTPASKLLGNVLEIMQKSGYVGWPWWQLHRRVAWSN
jgi:small subunit ribosomal protein S8